MQKDSPVAVHRPGHLWVRSHAAGPRQHRKQAESWAGTAPPHATSTHSCMQVVRAPFPLSTQGVDTEGLESPGRNVFGTGKAIMLRAFLLASERRNITETAACFSWRSGMDFPRTPTQPRNQRLRLE